MREQATLKSVCTKITIEQLDALSAMAGDTPIYLYVRELITAHLEAHGTPRQSIPTRGGDGYPVRKIHELQRILDASGKGGSITWERAGDGKYHYYWDKADGEKVDLSRGALNARQTLVRLTEG